MDRTKYVTRFINKSYDNNARRNNEKKRGERKQYRMGDGLGSLAFFKTFFGLHYALRKTLLTYTHAIRNACIRERRSVIFLKRLIFPPSWESGQIFFTLVMRSQLEHMPIKIPSSWFLRINTKSFSPTHSHYTQFELLRIFCARK